MCTKHTVAVMVYTDEGISAHNTVDRLVTILKLKEVGCECYFEKGEDGQRLVSTGIFDSEIAKC